MPLELEGRAKLIHINVRKQGAGEEDQELAVDYKLRCITSPDVLAYFHPTLKGFLFNPETGEPRFASMKAVKWEGTQRKMDLTIEATKFSDAVLKNFEFQPLVNDRLSLTFTASVFPLEAQVGTTAALLATEVALKVGHDQQQLDFGDSRAPHKTTAPSGDTPDVGPLKQALDTAETALAKVWPEPDENGEYSPPSEVLNFKDERLHIDCWAKIKLLQIGSDTWIAATDMVVPGDPPGVLPFPLTEENDIWPTRAAAIANEVDYIDEFCGEWLKAHKRDTIPAHRQAVTALRKWAQGLLVGGAPASVNEPPAKPTKKASKKP